MITVNPMKYKLLFLLFIWQFTGVAMAQPGHGKIMEKLKLSSKILGKEVAYTIYLPADYEYSSRWYPVVYLLHGYTDDDSGWLQFGEINRYADQAIAEGIIPPMIIVMPDGGVSWYINSYDGKVRYEDFFIQEFIPFIEKSYRIRTKKQYRGICGLSMGGYGTMNYALKYADLFSAAAPLSAAVWDDESLKTMPDQTYEDIIGPLFGPGLKGQDRINTSWLKNSTLELVKTKTSDELKKVRYWIDCGDDDFLTRGNALLHIALTDKQVPHEYRVRDGAHTWDYWRSGIAEALKFIGKSFHQ